MKSRVLEFLNANYPGRPYSKTPVYIVFLEVENTHGEKEETLITAERREDPIEKIFKIKEGSTLRFLYETKTEFGLLNLIYPEISEASAYIIGKTFSGISKTTKNKDVRDLCLDLLKVIHDREALVVEFNSKWLFLGVPDVIMSINNSITLWSIGKKLFSTEAKMLANSVLWDLVVEEIKNELERRTNDIENGKEYTIEELKKIYENGNYRLFSIIDQFSDLVHSAIFKVNGELNSKNPEEYRRIAKIVKKTIGMEYAEVGVGHDAIDIIVIEALRKEELIKNFYKSIEEKIGQ